MNSSRSKPMFLGLLLVTLLALAATQETGQESRCKKNIDLMFALDGSGSVKIDGFNKIKDFTKRVIQNFDIGQGKTHAGVVTFSEVGTLDIGLTESFDKDEMFKKVDGLKFPGFRTAIDDALRVCDKEFRKEGRQGVPQVLIFLTDGKCTVCKESVSTAVAPLKAAGVTIYTVGVTDKVNRTELEIISSDPSENYMFEVNDFDELKTIISKLNERTCIVKQGKCAKPLPPFNCAATRRDQCEGDESCSGQQKCCFDGCIHKCQFPLTNCLSPIDIAFAMDSSQMSKFENMKQFALNVVDSFKISQKDARFASIVYNDNKAAIKFTFERYDSVNAVKQAITGLRHQRLDADSPSAPEVLSSDIFSLQGQVRTRRPQVLIIFYSGTTDLPDYSELKAYGVKIIVVGVGQSFNKDRLSQIAESSSAVFTADSFNNLLPELQLIASESCYEKPGTCPADPPFFNEEMCKFMPGINECESDFDCYGNAKCCKQGCNNKCYLPLESCKRKVDIAFGIHQNIEFTDFEFVKRFLKSSLQKFRIGQEDSHAALMTFGREAKIEFDFNSPQISNQNLLSKIDNLRLTRGKGTLMDLLRMACDKVFCAAGGTRLDVPKILVIVTGPFDRSNPTELEQRIKILRARGVEILLIGVGNIDTSVAQAITSDDKNVDNRVLLTKYYDGLSQYVQDVSDFACTEAVLPAGITDKDQCSVVPKECVKGPKGSRGRGGDHGKRGRTGERGAPGKVGLRGQQGSFGDDGFDGPVGDRGPKGNIGVPGFPGYDGIPGVPGVEGRNGLDGCCGFPGKSGEAGIAGLNGFQGISGPRGRPGIKGRKGEPGRLIPRANIQPGEKGSPGGAGFSGFKGNKGEIGFLGTFGDDGVDGSLGPKGFAGDVGDDGTVTIEKGEKGFQGDRGDIGSPGPEPATGPEIDNFEILKGVKGEPGFRGDDGEPGARGLNSNVQGFKGVTGIRGEEGDIGIVGFSGFPGFPGRIGEPGFKGERGVRGPEGDSGRTGRKGITGDVGAKGFSGAKGRRGHTGEPFPGNKGRKGQPGVDGNNAFGGGPGRAGSFGQKGEPGMSVAGPVGDDGEAGFVGFPGRPGTPGAQGMSGNMGRKGEKGNQGAKGDRGRNARIIAGDPGMGGPRGPKGIEGPIGDEGPPGRPGRSIILDCKDERTCPYRKGDRGSRGPFGETGSRGRSGRTGQKGFPGFGSSGPSGIDGFPGETGSPGKVGEKGEKGFVGDQGRKGQKGIRGRNRLSSGSKGFKGQKGERGDLGRPGGKGPDSPGNVVVSKGRKGIQGSDGRPGLRGLDGPAGFKGFQGFTEPGRRGREGPKGMLGAAGSRGFDGADGDNGRRGDRGDNAFGSKGYSGEVGEEGFVGGIGATGAKGRKGERGEPPADIIVEAGDKGPTGDIGPRGPSGRPGAEGIKGRRGPRGDRGQRGLSVSEKGDRGERGKPGNDGDPGRQGRFGFNGPRGRPGEPGKAGEASPGPEGRKGDTGDRGTDGRRGPDGTLKPGCFNLGDSVDLAFIMDSSNSVNEVDFNKQKEVIFQILKNFAVGPRETQAGVIKYGESANIEISFNDYATFQALRKGIADIKHDLATVSRLDLALKLARDELFTKRRGARSDDRSIEKALVIIGDGHISGKDDSRMKLMDNARNYARQLKRAGVLVFTLAVGTEKNRILLREFASKTIYSVEAKTYAELVLRINILTEQLIKTCTMDGERGKNGAPGPRGDQGPRGDKGQPGFGVKGYPGFNGEKGQKGEPADESRGEVGDAGRNGEKGERGFDGFSGFGLIGADGRRGDKGDRAFGARGSRGDRGEQGPRGLIGPDGSYCEAILASDVIFVLDTSSDVGFDNFERMKNYLYTVIRSFDVDNLLTRVGIITFDSSARNAIKLNKHNNLRSLFNDITNLRYNNGESRRMDLALLTAVEGFSEANGGREGVKKIVIFVTNGRQSFSRNQIPLNEAVRPLINAGIHRYAVAIGSRVSKSECSTIAGDNVLFVDDFNSLLGKVDDQIRLIGRTGCKGETGFDGRKGQLGDNGFTGRRGQPGEDGQPGAIGAKGRKGRKGVRGSVFNAGRQGQKGDRGDEGPAGLPGCSVAPISAATDLVFVIDASASLYDFGFKKELEFVNDIIDKVGPISRNGLRAGVVVYSDKANARVYLNEHFDTDSFKAVVRRLPYDDAGETRIDLGFEESKKLFEISNGARGSSRKILILMTDGQQTYVPDIKQPSEIAKELADDGVDIFSIGIGEEIDRVELESYITRPEHIFLSSDISMLITRLTPEIVQALKCEGGPPGPTGVSGFNGPPGEQGLVGRTGDRGPRGERGEPGFGIDGEPGEQGFPGFPGFNGDKGFRGPDGEVGPRGRVGEKGSVGQHGPQGEDGRPGFDGFRGERGPTGSKGERGDVRGFKGRKGQRGDRNVKGDRGEPGRLPFGMNIDDLKGSEGVQGQPGRKGDEGLKGRVIIIGIIGPIGLGGFKGNKGEPGAPGPQGLFGPEGERGAKGSKGFRGSFGDFGVDGNPGINGDRGTKGDVGNAGFSRKGDSGEEGPAGAGGEMGPQGFDGDFGFTGSPGRRGERGDRGRPGRQQFPDRNNRETQGKRGEKGFSGDLGFTGEPGEPGMSFQLKGLTGDKGQPGFRGFKGDQGERGPQGGRFPFDGPKGFKGRAGDDGNPGEVGRQGRRGEAGPISFGRGRVGDAGSVGSIGLVGRPGLDGLKGFSGDTGRQGSKGAKGRQGPSGFRGFSGSQGRRGPDGNKGQTGEKGQAGLEGQRGPAGVQGTTSGHVVVRHSQNYLVPRCPRNYKVMWEGYSLMYTVGNGYAHSQDLGDAGSCARSFSTLPFLFCSITGTCKYATRNDFTYWLSGDVTQPMMPVSNDAIEPFISRCVVCEAPDITMAVHSQDVQEPSCPTGYESLWSGYSFMMVAAAGASGAGQSLGSSGSCLEKFRAKPFIECQGARGTCHFFSDKFSFWLTTIKRSEEFEIPKSATLSKTKGDDLTQKVSRCRVCLRSKTQPRSRSAGDTINRFVRSVKDIMGM